MTTLPDLVAPPGDLGGESLPVFMQRWTGQTQLPPKVSQDPAVRRAEAIFERNSQQDRDLSAMRQTLQAKRVALEEMPSNTADREERFARIQKLKNLEFDTEHFNG